MAEQGNSQFQTEHSEGERKKSAHLTAAEVGNRAEKMISNSFISNITLCLENNSTSYTRTVSACIPPGCPQGKNPVSYILFLLIYFSYYKHSSLKHYC